MAKGSVLKPYSLTRKAVDFTDTLVHISDPGRLAQLMMAACLAYIWVVYLGNFAMQQGLNTIIHRTDRCDLSLFQLGLRKKEYLLNQEMDIPAAFCRLE